MDEQLILKYKSTRIYFATLLVFAIISLLYNLKTSEPIGILASIIFIMLSVIAIDIMSGKVERLTSS